MERPSSSNVLRTQPSVSRQAREKRNAHGAAVLWFTGLSGAGKSTIARAVDKRLFEMGCQTAVLDGDNLRHGLCGDLEFTASDRTENVRRAAEVARLFYEHGAIVLCTFVSPFSADRDFARSIIEPGRFIEVYVQCELDICKLRDPKGLYRKAMSGEITGFTGVDSPYEAPTAPEVSVHTSIVSVEDAAELVVGQLRTRGLLGERLSDKG
jgi:adenylyl-sulfate kinase